MVADYLKIKIKEGWVRIARENPGVDFGVDTPVVNRAWDALDKAYMAWAEGRVTLADVKKIFDAWERELLAAQKPTELFECAK